MVQESKDQTNTDAKLLDTTKRGEFEQSHIVLVIPVARGFISSAFLGIRNEMHLLPHPQFRI